MPECSSDAFIYTVEHRGFHVTFNKWEIWKSFVSKSIIIQPVIRHILETHEKGVFTLTLVKVLISVFPLCIYY